MEQLQLVALSGADGNSIVTAPQWQVPISIMILAGSTE